MSLQIHRKLNENCVHIANFEIGIVRSLCCRRRRRCHSEYRFEVERHRFKKQSMCQNCRKLERKLHFGNVLSQAIHVRYVAVEF